MSTFSIRALAPKPLVIVLMAFTGFGISGCTGEEIAASIGVVAIGAGAIAVGVAAGSNTPSGHFECRSGYRNSCNTYSDYHGRTHSDCRPVRDGCADRTWVRHGKVVRANVSAFESLQNIRPSRVEWAETFGLSLEGAEALTAALTAARTGDESGLKNLGLGHGDLRSLAQLNMPSQQGVDALARSLDQDPEQTKAMLQTLIAHGAEMRAQLCQADHSGAPRLLCAQ